MPARMRKRKFPLPGYVHLAKQFFLTILFKYSLSAHAFFSVEVPGSSGALGTWGGTALRRQNVMQCWLWLAHQDEGVVLALAVCHLQVGTTLVSLCAPPAPRSCSRFWAFC